MPLPPDISGSPKACTDASVAWLARFEEQVNQASSKAALICGAQSMTYRALNERANQVAHLLASRGIGRGKRVGLGLSRSLDLVVALFGILKAGAAYVPLDPSYPSARLAQMISSAGLECVITTPEKGILFPEVPQFTVDAASLADFPVTKPEIVISDGDPIYAIFTSGSTGAPKAASVYHRGFSNLLAWYGSELGLNENDVALIISSPSFDLTQKNFYAPLLAGGSLILDDQEIYDLSRITRLLRNEVTLINCTPSAFYPLVDAAAANDYRDLSSLRFVVLGGEPISIPRLRPWLEHPNCRAEIVNSYGPTECTDICLFHRLNQGNLDEFPFVPLGREIPNVIVTIRDESLAILADGNIGELCIEGISLGAGYLNDPEKTASRFVHGLYLTGDLAKRLPCGTFEFRGRADHQVKIHGFRIELGEIEIAISQHAAVREAVVIGRDNRLTAFIQGNVSPGELRTHLSSRLPGYMIPGEYIFAESLPLTPNGKVDRKALSESRTVPPTHAAPSTSELEARLLRLWSEILGHPVEDPTANFFDIGGNSIHLAVMHMRLCEMTQKVFPITELFGLPTVRSIAAFLSPKAEVSSISTAQDRARLAQAGYSRFRRPTSR